MNEKLKKLIINNLRKHGYNCKLESGGNEIASRCPYCGGSESNRNKRQFYIKADKPPYVFHCFKCGISGTISKLIMDFPEIFSDVITEFPSTVMKYDIDVEEYKKPIVSLDDSVRGDLCTSCYFYLVSRMPTAAISHIEDKLVCCKHLQKIDSDLKNFIGFISFDNSQIICRNKDKNSTVRYKNVKLSNERYFNYFVSTIYVDNKELDLQYNCVVGEGIFTVINSVYKIRYGYGGFDKNYVAIASLSKSKLEYLIKYMLKDLPFEFVNIYIVLDKDKDIDEQIRKYSRLVEKDSRYKLVIPETSKDMADEKIGFRIKTNKEVLECKLNYLVTAQPSTPILL